MHNCLRCGSVPVKKEGDLCKVCQIADKKRQEYEEKKRLEVLEFQKMLKEGLCDYCEKVSVCNLASNPKVGKCKSMERCMQFERRR